MSGNDDFARYVTSTAFSLSLSGHMISALDHLMRCKVEGSWVEGPPPGWTSACASLIRRGLAYNEPHPDNERWRGLIRVTEAGRVVHQLCVMAGLAAPLTDSERRAA